MDFKSFFNELNKNIQNDWDDCDYTERDFFFSLFDSQIKLWETAGYTKQDSIEHFSSEFLEMVKYYMEEYLKNI